MKNLQYTLEGVLNGLDNDVEAGVSASTAERLNKFKQDMPLNCQDVARRKVKLGDTVLMFQPGQLVLGKIAEFHRGGTQLKIEALDNPENIYYPLTNCVLKIKDVKQIPTLIKIFGL